MTKNLVMEKGLILMKELPIQNAKAPETRKSTRVTGLT